MEDRKVNKLLKIWTILRRERALRRLHREINRARQSFGQPPIEGDRIGLLRTIIDVGRRR